MGKGRGWAEDHIPYKELLDKAYDHGLISIEAELEQAPTKENGMLAIAKAKAVFENINPKTGEKSEGQRVFKDIGDASPENVGNRNIALHIIRMASTRAKGRCLRDGINIGEAMNEELADAPTPESSGATQGAARDARPQMIRPETREAIANIAAELYPQEDGPPSGIAKVKQLIVDNGGNPNWSLNNLTETSAQRLLANLQEKADEKVVSEVH